MMDTYFVYCASPDALPRAVYGQPYQYTNIPKRKKRRRSRADYDSPWKEAIEQLFPQFMAFFFPVAFAAIDWTRAPVFMDKELQRIMPGSATGRQAVDKLVKVWLNDGKETFLLIHIEVQSKKEDDFDRRMFIYNTTLYLTLGQTVVSLAILADEIEDWHPKSYSYGHWGFTMEMTLMKYIPEFLQDAMEDGIEIGELKALRDMITKTLILRFQTVPEEFRENLARIEDSTLLEKLHSQAVLAGSLEDFMRFIETEMRVPN